MQQLKSVEVETDVFPLSAMAPELQDDNESDSSVWELPAAPTNSSLFTVGQAFSIPLVY